MLFHGKIDSREFIGTQAKQIFRQQLWCDEKSRCQDLGGSNAGGQHKLRVEKLRMGQRCSLGIGEGRFVFTGRD